MDLIFWDRLITIVASIVGLLGCLFCLYHHFFIKPKQKERMRQLNQKLLNRLRDYK